MIYSNKEYYVFGNLCKKADGDNCQFANLWHGPWKINLEWARKQRGSIARDASPRAAPGGFSRAPAGGLSAAGGLLESCPYRHF